MATETEMETMMRIYRGISRNTPVLHILTHPNTAKSRAPRNFTVSGKGFRKMNKDGINLYLQAGHIENDGSKRG